MGPGAKAPAGRGRSPALIIFDCDGVLVDSEAPSNRVVAQEVTALGWPMTEAESMQAFVGFQLRDIPAVVQPHLAHPIPEGWVEHLRRQIIAAFDTLQPMPGAAAALEAVHAMGLPLRVASNSSHAEMQVKFGRTGLAHLVSGRIHSAYDVPRGKPHPDVFLHAAAAEGIDPARCLVVEDSIPGTRAARAAGMRVVGLDPHGHATEALRTEGATVIRHLDELPPLIESLRAQP